MRKQKILLGSLTGRKEGKEGIDSDNVYHVCCARLCSFSSLCLSVTSRVLSLRFSKMTDNATNKDTSVNVESKWTVFYRKNAIALPMMLQV